jgi:hypothetical protein
MRLFGVSGWIAPSRLALTSLLFIGLYSLRIQRSSIDPITCISCVSSWQRATREEPTGSEPQVPCASRKRGNNHGHSYFTFMIRNIVFSAALLAVLHALVAVCEAICQFRQCGALSLLALLLGQFNHLLGEALVLHLFLRLGDHLRLFGACALRLQALSFGLLVLDSASTSRALLLLLLLAHQEGARRRIDTLVISKPWRERGT